MEVAVAFPKGILIVTYLSTSCLMEFELAGTVKIGGFDTFSKCKSPCGGGGGSGCHVSHGSPLKMSSRTSLYGNTYVKLKDSHRNQWGERIQSFKVVGLLRDH
jgi:hypothetical protein